MAQVGFKVHGGIDSMSSDDASNGKSFNLSEPAGWAMVWWFLSVIIIALVIFSL